MKMDKFDKIEKKDTNENNLPLKIKNIITNNNVHCFVPSHYSLVKSGYNKNNPHIKERININNSIENDLYKLVEMCSEILTDKPIAFIINSYTTGLSKTILETVLKLTIKKDGIISSDELCIPMKDSDMVLPCGSYTRWEKK